MATSLLTVGFVAQANQAVVGPFLLSQDAFDIYYTQGGGVPTSQAETITNQGSSVVTTTISVPNQPGWLTDSYTTEPIPNTPGQPAGIGVDVAPQNLAVGTYTTALYISGNFTGSPIVVPIRLHVLSAGTPQPDTQAHPEGSNVRGPDGTVYRISSGARWPYTSAGAFLSYGYNHWVDVQDANAVDMSLPIPTQFVTELGTSTPAYIPPRDGSLINDRGTIYIISNGFRQGFASAQVFLDLGYSFANVLPGDASFLTALAPLNSSQIAHPPGTVVNDRGTICVIISPFKNNDHTTSRRCFATLSDMNSWGIQSRDIIKANSFDRQLSMNGTIDARMQYSPLNP